jgi:hypothetical protein
MPFRINKVNRFLSCIGVVLTVAYLAFIWWLFGERWDEIRTMQPNNIGDVLAGAFAPLAIFWLVLGFFQQGVELRQNTSALELQAQELKNSVNQQRELARVSAEQLVVQIEALKEERQKSAAAVLPRFLFVCKGHSGGGTVVKSHFSLVNIGAPAAKVALRPSDPVLDLSLSEITVFAPYGEHAIEMMLLSRQVRPRTALALSCVNAMGAGFTWKYEVVLDNLGRVSEIVESPA